MKFLCVECNEAMSLRDTRGPDGGSMTVVFGCPACGRETAMLTNAMETQVVRSLGVTIGGRTVPAEPMEMVRGSLRGAHDGHHGSHSISDDRRSEDVSRAGFPDGHGTDVDATRVDHTTDERPVMPTTSTPRESKCPFTGMVEDAFAREGFAWTDAARERTERIPPFARGMAMKGVEDYARERGYSEISETVLDEVRDRFGL